MFCTTKINSILSILTGIALVCAPFASAAYAGGNMKADITVVGTVTVNGQRAVSNSTVVSDSKVTTGSGSSATIGLGGNGRVVLSPETSLTLKYTETSLVAIIASGKVRIFSASGFRATVSTRNATVVADPRGANSFSVDMGCGDADCPRTIVKTTTGVVTLKTSDETQLVTAGTEAVGGGSENACRPCYRPGSGPPVPLAAVGSNGLIAVLISLGGTLGASIFVGKKDDKSPGGPVPDVSPLL